MTRRFVILFQWNYFVQRILFQILIHPKNGLKLTSEYLEFPFSTMLLVFLFYIQRPSSLSLMERTCNIFSWQRQNLSCMSTLVKVRLALYSGELIQALPRARIWCRMCGYGPTLFSDTFYVSLLCLDVNILHNQIQKCVQRYICCL